MGMLELSALMFLERMDVSAMTRGDGNHRRVAPFHERTGLPPWGNGPISGGLRTTVDLLRADMWELIKRPVRLGATPPPLPRPPRGSCQRRTGQGSAALRPEVMHRERVCGSTVRNVL